MRKSLNKDSRQRAWAPDTADSSYSEENLKSKLVLRKCSSRSLHDYEKRTMQRGYSNEKKQSHRKKPEVPTKEHLQARRSRTKTKGSHFKVKQPTESDSLYNYAPPSSKPSVENIPNRKYSYSSQDEKRFKDSDDEPKYARETSKYYKNNDGNLNYNRFNPNHNIHKNVSPVKKQPSYVRSATGSNNLLSVREYNKMLNNDSTNSYGYFHGDKNNKLCYISNRPVYYDNNSINEKVRYRQNYNELSNKKSSDLKMISKSDTSIAQPAKKGQNHPSDGSNKNIGKDENYLSKMDRSTKKSHHNEKSILDINTSSTNDRLIVTSKNSEITRLTNEIAKKLQNIGLSITTEPLQKSKARRKKEDNSEERPKPHISCREAESKESCTIMPEKGPTTPPPNPQRKEIDIEEEVKRTTEPSNISKGPKFKHHTKYYVSNSGTPEDKCPCNDPTAKQKDLHGCCYREGEHVSPQMDHVNLKQDYIGCCNPGRNIYENLEVCDMSHIYKPDEHARMLTHNLVNLPHCQCAFNDTKCECTPDAMTKLGLYNNSKRSRSPLTAVNKKTNGVYVFVPLPENSNDPVEMSKHLQNIYNNIIPQGDKQDQKNENHTSAQKSDPSKNETSKGANENSSGDKDKSKSEEADTETARAKLLTKLLDEYNLTQLKELLEKKAASKNDDIVEELKRLKQKNVGRRHSDLHLNFDQSGRSPLRTRKCPSESSFIMKNNGIYKPWQHNEQDKYGCYNDSRFGNMPEYATPFQQLQQSMFPEPPLNNYQNINLPFQEFVSDLSKYRAAPYGTGQAMFYTRTKSPKSYHGTQQPPPPPLPIIDPNIKPGQPLASSIVDPTIPFQAKLNAAEARETSPIYSRPKSPSQTFNYGLDMATKRHHQRLIDHAHHQSHPKPSFDTMSDPLMYGKLQSPFYPTGEPSYMQSHAHGLYDIPESVVDYLPRPRSPRYDYSPTRFDRFSAYDQPSCGHKHRSLKAQYYKRAHSPPPPEPSEFGFEIPSLQTCHNHGSRSYSYALDHHHGDRNFVDFREKVHYIDADSRSPSILKKLSDVVAKPFSLLFKVEPDHSAPRHKSHHLKGILKSPIDEEEDEDSYEYYYSTSNTEKKHSHEKSHHNQSNHHSQSHHNQSHHHSQSNHSKHASYDLEDMDLDNISQPPMEYVTVVDPFQTDSFESMHEDGESKKYGDSASTGGQRSPRKNSPSRR